MIHVTEIMRTMSYPQQPGKCLLGDISRSIRIERCPGLLKAPDFFPADGIKSAASLIHIRETFENERYKQRYKNVHADDVPRNKQATSPGRTPTIALKEIVLRSAIRE